MLAFVVLGGAFADSANAAGGALPSSAGAATAPRPVMGDYSASKFAQQAATLPPALNAAIQQDLGESGATYLGDAAAAADGVQVVASLKSRGVSVLSSKMVGSHLVVNVASPADVASVTAAGATAQVDAAVPSYSGLHLKAASTLLGGTAYGYITSSNGTSESGIACSVGFNGVSTANNAPEFVTAGHCVPSGTPSVSAITQTQPGLGGNVTLGATIGTAVGGSFEFGNGIDSGLISVGSGYTPAPQVSTWGGGAGSPSSSAISVTGETPAIDGAAICKSGATTGWTCGHVLSVDQPENIADDGGVLHSVNAILTDACVLPGDSGGSLLIGSLAAGITSGSSFSSCAGGGMSAFFPMESANSPSGPSVATHFGSGWELSVAVPTPVVAASAAFFQGSAFTGSLPGDSAGEIVHLTLNGVAQPGYSIPTNGAQWSFPLTGVATGTYTYSIYATFGSHSTSAKQTGTVTIVPRPAVSRISSTDRYSTSVAIAESGYSTANVVYLATGANYPDALSAAPAAVEQNAPLLLTTPDSLPDEVAAEINTLAPHTVVVVGGTSSISPEVVSQLEALSSSPHVTRIAGVDRYETSRKVVNYAFAKASGPLSAFVATGANFPDALSAGAAAGAHHEPVILVPGTAAPLDAATKSLLSSLDITSVTIAGGASAVSPTTAASFSQLLGATNVKQLAGVDRYATSQLINAAAFPNSASTIYLATGTGFPDALSGAALAGKNGAPLFVVQPTCIPDGVVSAAGKLGTTSVGLLGGPASLSASVFSLSICN